MDVRINIPTLLSLHPLIDREGHNLRRLDWLEAGEPGGDRECDAEARAYFDELARTPARIAELRRAFQEEANGLVRVREAMERAYGDRLTVVWEPGESVTSGLEAQMLRVRELCVVVWVSASAASCAPSTDRQALVPEEVIDLGALVTPDLPEQVWGRAFLDAMGFNKPNEFEVIPWSYGADGDRVSGQNSYFTLFNHGGPHVDAPNHIGLPSGVDAYPIESFTGPLKVLDVRGTEPGWTVGRDHFEGLVDAGDVVLIYTDYQAPTGGDFPAVVALSREAAEYLAQIPIRAFGTDSFSADSPQGVGPIDAPTAVGRVAPVHDSFLSRGIPVYEQLRNLDRLLGQQRLYFVGAPLNMAAGDGMMVRPVALVY